MQEQNNELRRFATSSNFRSTACVPFRQWNRNCQADGQRGQRALSGPTVAVVFAGGLPEHDDQNALGPDCLSR